MTDPDFGDVWVRAELSSTKRGLRALEQHERWRAAVDRGEPGSVQRHHQRAAGRLARRVLYGEHVPAGSVVARGKARLLEDLKTLLGTDDPAEVHAMAERARARAGGSR